jgi:hypothetical protein
LKQAARYNTRRTSRAVRQRVQEAVYKKKVYTKRIGKVQTSSTGANLIACHLIFLIFLLFIFIFFLAREAAQSSKSSSRASEK